MARYLVALCAIILSGCAVAYQSGSKQFGWTIGPAQMTRSLEHSHMGWCIEPDISLRPHERSH